MASKLNCSACIRTLRRRSHQIWPVRNLLTSPPAFAILTFNQPYPSFPPFRSLSSVSSHFAAQPAAKSYEPSSSPNASSAPVEEDESHPYRSKTSPTKKLAQEFRKLAPNFTETYVAYDATASLIKECARQADYTIPERMEKDVEIPRTANDEDLGVGTGWWYDSTSFIHPPFFHIKDKIHPFSPPSPNPFFYPSLHRPS